MVAPAVAVAAIVAGVLLARGAVQREVFTVLVFLLVGLRAVALGFRDWREPVAGTFLFGALVLAVESVVGAAASQDWGPPLIVLMPVFFVGSLVSRAVSVWMTDDAEELPHGRARALAPARGERHVVDPGRDGRRGRARPARTACSITSGRSWHRWATRSCPLFVFVFEQLARPIFWLVDKLGIDPEGARRVLERAQRSAAHAGGRAADRVGQPSLLGRMLGLALFVLAVWGVIRFMRRLTPESVESDLPAASPAASVTSATLAEPPPDHRVGSRAGSRPRTGCGAGTARCSPRSPVAGWRRTRR